MKKIIACISLVFAMSAGVTALAADATYTKDTNDVAIDATGYTTVLIEDAADNIWYVDQNDSGLGSTAKFLMKADPADGTYTVTLGGSSTAAATTSTFTITSRQPIVKAVEVMGKEYAADGATYSIGCKATATLEECAYVVVTAVKDSATKVAYYETNFTGEGEVNIGVKITDVPSDVNVTVGLSDYKPE